MISRKTQKALIKEVQENTGLKFYVRFVKLGDGATGQIQLNKKIIELDKNKRHTKSTFLSVLFHEIGHLIAFKKKKFRVFHTESGIFRSRKTAQIFLRTAMQAEKYVDRIGKKLCRKHYWGVRWDEAYDTKADIDWFHLGHNYIRKFWGMKLYKKQRKRNGKAYRTRRKNQGSRTKGRDPRLGKKSECPSRENEKN